MDILCQMLVKSDAIVMPHLYLVIAERLKEKKNECNQKKLQVVHFPFS